MVREQARTNRDRVVYADGTKRRRRRCFGALDTDDFKAGFLVIGLHIAPRSRVGGKADRNCSRAAVHQFEHLFNMATARRNHNGATLRTRARSALR